MVTPSWIPSVAPGAGGSNLSGGAAAPLTDLLWYELDALATGMKATSWSQAAATTFVAGCTAALSAGYLVWTSRFGYLLASLVTAMPAWRRFDPLEILDLWEKEAKSRRRAPGFQSDEEDEAALQALFG